MADLERKSILTVSAARHLTGEPVEKVLEEAWAKAPPHTVKRFDNVAFNADPADSATTLRDLRTKLQSRDWDGVLLGWCVRGHAEFTVLFEDMMNLVVEETRKKPHMRLIFVTGPDNLVEATVRNFP